MTKTPDETKKGLVSCISVGKCWTECPYFAGEALPFTCIRALSADALALIQQLQAENAEKDARIKQLEAERDALIDVVKDWGGACVTCEHYSNEPDEIPCRFCIEMHPEDEDRISHWKWRGVQKGE